MPYEPNRRHPLGQNEHIFAADAARLKALFEAKIPVRASACGTFYIAEGHLPGEWTPPDQEAHPGG
ncbi:MAG: hypothetical protein V4712_11030 [Pseudomonadota bacterium]